VIWYFFNGSNDSPCQSYLRQLLAMKWCHTGPRVHHWKPSTRGSFLHEKVTARVMWSGTSSTAQTTAPAKVNFVNFHGKSRHSFYLLAEVWHFFNGSKDNPCHKQMSTHLSFESALSDAEKRRHASHDLVLLRTKAPAKVDIVNFHGTGVPCH
jgi:hypothetical protein